MSEQEKLLKDITSEIFKLEEKFSKLQTTLMYWQLGFGFLLGWIIYDLF